DPALLAHQADAEALARQRNEPAPALRHDEDLDVAGGAEDGAEVGAELAEVGEHRRLAEGAEGDEGAVPPPEEAVLTRGVDDVATAQVGPGGPHLDGVGATLHGGGPHPEGDPRPGALRRPDQLEIEGGPIDLEGGPRP